MEREIPFRFDVSFDEEGLRPTNDPELYLEKVRVFYKYSNRNGSYITDEYAEKLSKSAYFKPVIGTYSHMNQDFLGHEGPVKAKAYGFVLPDSLSWKEHLDDDGVTRIYATYDALIWAEYWDEAKKITRKSQSMEIDPKTIKGSWRTNEESGLEEYVYDEGTMAGICILGDEKTPCFEGAAFFSADDSSYIKFTKAVEKYYSNNGGKDAMNVKVAGLEHENFEALWNALNPNFNEEGAYSINFIPCEITEENVFALSCENPGKVNKYSYAFNEEKALSVELVEEIDYKANMESFEAKVGELTSTLETANGNYSELKSQYDALVAEKEEVANKYEALLQDFAAKEEELKQKEAVVTEQSATIADYEAREKEAIIDKFSTCLPAETLQEIADKKSSMSVKDLNTTLALEYTNFSFAKERKEQYHIPQDPEEDSPLIRILKNYKKQ